MKHTTIMRVGWGLTFLLLSLITPLTLAQSQITICHITGNGDHHILEISENGWNGHSNHPYDFVIQSDSDRARCNDNPDTPTPNTPTPNTPTPDTPTPNTPTPNTPTPNTPTPNTPTPDTPTPDTPTPDTPTPDTPTPDTPTPDTPTPDTPTPDTPTPDTPTPDTPTPDTPTPDTPTPDTPTPDTPTPDTPTPDTPTPEPTCEYEVEAADASGLLDAVDLANNDGHASVICLGGGTYAVDISLSITTEIDIHGNDSTILPANNIGGSIIDVANANLNIQNLTIRNGVSNYGGALSLSASTLTLTNVALINNNASSNGGAIYNFNSTLVINNSEFLSNQASIGGAIYMVGSSAYVSVSATGFTKNEASVGGAIRNDSGQLLINTSSFIDNRATAESSVISHGSSGSVNIQMTVIQANTSDNGAAVASGNADFTINNSCVFDNTSATDDVLNSSIIGEIDATNNWWGTALGANQPGADTVSEQVIFIPFLGVAPAICAP